MSSKTPDRACLAYTRQSAFGRRQSLPRVSYTSTMKQIMGCYHLHIERTQTIRKDSSVGNDRPLSLICLLRSSSFSEAGLQALPSVLTIDHGPACVLLVVVPGPSPLRSLRENDHSLLLRYALRFQSWSQRDDRKWPRMNLVKHMSSKTTDRACLAYTRQSAFGRRQSLPRVSYTSTMKQIMGCYHLYIERT